MTSRTPTVHKSAPLQTFRRRPFPRFSFSRSGCCLATRPGPAALVTTPEKNPHLSNRRTEAPWERLGSHDCPNESWLSRRQSRPCLTGPLVLGSAKPGYPLTNQHTRPPENALNHRPGRWQWCTGRSHVAKPLSGRSAPVRAARHR